MTAFMLIPAVLLFLLSGHIILKLADRNGSSGLSALAWAGLSFMLGLGAISLQMFFYSLVSIPFNTILVSGPWIAAGAVMLFHPAFKRKGFRPEEGRAGWPGIILAAVILSQVLYSFAYSLTMPLSGWDAWFIWFVKARAFFMDKGVEPAFLTNPVYVQDHPEYPLLVPLAISWVYTAMGSAGEWAGKALYPLQFAALLSIFHFAVKKTSCSKQAGLIFTALLSMTPLLLIHAGGFPVQVDPSYAVKDQAGYADLAIAIYFLASGLFIFLFARDGGPHFIMLASIMLAMGAWTKNEGLTFALIGFVILAFSAFFKHRMDSKTLAFALIFLVIFILPWSVFKSVHGLGSEYVENMGPGVFFANLSRLSEIVPFTARYMFLKPGIMGLVWWAYVISSVLNMKNVLRSRTFALHALILGQLCAYIFVYIITPVDLKWHLGTSLDRLLLHLIPLGMLASAVNLTALARGDSRERQ